MNHILIDILKYLVTSDFKTVEDKFLDQGIEKSLIDEYFKDFKKLKDQHRITDNKEKDINFWGKEDWDSFVGFVDKLKEEKSKTEEKKLQKMEGAELFAENKDWYVYKIINHKACMKYGSNTKWCITQEGGSHWDSYSKQNNIYFYIAKSPFKDSIAEEFYKIAALVDGAGKIEYWDAKDENIYLRDFEQADTMPKDKLEAYEKMIDIKGTKYKINEIPDSTTVEGDLSLENSGLKKLPKNLKVKGTLKLSFNPIEELPYLEAEYLLCKNCQITKIDPNIKVKAIDLANGFKADEMPFLKNVTVSMKLSYNESLKTLPKNLKLSRELDISKTSISDIPYMEVADIVCKENNITSIDPNIQADLLNLKQSHIAKLPLLKDVSRLDLTKCNMKTIEIHPNQRVLDISNTRLKKLPAANLEVFIAKGAKIEKIDPNFRVTELMDLEKAKITKLPDGLKLEELILKGSTLKDLPKNLVVDKLDISGTRITSLNVEGLKVGQINMDNCPVNEIPDNIGLDMGKIYQGRDTFEHSHLKKLPPMEMPFRGSFNLAGSLLEELPETLIIDGDLILRGLPHLKKLPKVLEVSGLLSIVGVPLIKKLPAKLKCKTLLVSEGIEIPKTVKCEHIQVY